MYRIRFTVVALVILSFLWISVMGCDTVQRHKVLTFFFDGVPPLAGETEQEQEATQEAVFRGAITGQGPKRPEVVWFTHEPEKDCSRCHKRLESARWALPEFVEPMPELCYSDCHVDNTEWAAFVHGPVAVGECLFCHNPHRSKNEFLLKRPIPELCYLCHNRKLIDSIENHSMESYSRCNSCHEAHTSSIKSLLKMDWQEKGI